MSPAVSAMSTLTLPRGVTLPQRADLVRLVLHQRLQLPPLLYHRSLRRPNPHPVPPLLNHLQRTHPLLPVVLRYSWRGIIIKYLPSRILSLIRRRRACTSSFFPIFPTKLLSSIYNWGLDIPSQSILGASEATYNSMDFVPSIANADGAGKLAAAVKARKPRYIRGFNE